VLTVACSAIRPRSPAQSAADEAVAHNIYAALDADRFYFYRHVDVRVDDGVASLHGYVWSVDALYRARQIARSVPGVKSVVSNDLALEREGRDNGVTR
jgi:osmotically-inducible protein OsmY